MNDLQQLLDRAAGGSKDCSGDFAGDAGPDLHRGRRAILGQRVRRTTSATAGLALAAVLAVPVIATSVDHRDQVTATPGSTTKVSPSKSIRLASSHLAAGPFTLGVAPQGWKAEGTSPSSAVVGAYTGEAREDGVELRLTQAVAPDGARQTYEGRVFWVRHYDDSEAVLISTRTQSDDAKPGTIEVQFDDTTGWSTETMIKFVSSVRVGDSAHYSLG